eukprot:scaffold27670_cov112-Isochrysis_galbana.AAC.1
MNTAIGTWNGGAGAIDNMHWPAAFWIDYVRVWQHEVNIGCSPPDYPTKEYIAKNIGLYGEPAEPVGTDTCKEIYPQSAYDHAAEIQARATRVRDERKADSHAAVRAEEAQAKAAKAEAAHEEAQKAVEAAAAAGRPVGMVLPQQPLAAQVLASVGRSSPAFDLPARAVPRFMPRADVPAAQPAAAQDESSMPVLVAAVVAVGVFASALAVRRRRQRAYDAFEEPLAGNYQGL